VGGVIDGVPRSARNSVCIGLEGLDDMLR